MALPIDDHFTRKAQSFGDPHILSKVFIESEHFAKTFTHHN